MNEDRTNLIPNYDFKDGELGQLPLQWSLFSPQSYLAPNFRLVKKDGAKVLEASGNGNDNCIGWVAAHFPVEGGKTYAMRVQFDISEQLDPNKNLLFSFWANNTFNDGIFQFNRMTDGRIEGIGKFALHGAGEMAGEVRIAFRLSADGEAWIHEIELAESEPISQRNVRAACVEGTGDLTDWERVLEKAGECQADIILLPETFLGSDPAKAEPIDGPSASLMSRKARQHRMYVSGTFLHRDAADGHIYNTGLVFDREGNRMGRYDKIHLYSPELLHKGISPGREVPVFQADFGRLGMMICYDSWFTDVIELLALKGAEIVLFPNEGYYRSLLPARANDNGVRIICSSLNNALGVWDTSGADVEAPALDTSRCSNNDRTFKDVDTVSIGDVRMLLITLDLNQSPSAHNWGGPMMSSPGGRRNRREQKDLLVDEIKKEINLWSSS